MNPMLVNVVKGLIMDATRAANSGHPGGAMSSADYACVLFRDFLKYDPSDPKWFDRDRFVLSAGHESMLLYSLLHLAGFLSMDEIKRFRQWGSLTPGHPEHDLTPGVEATTGPLGQGLAMAVGMAAAEAHLRARLGADVCDHYTYVLASDGDFQEGVAYGAATLAGLWGLGKLIVYYDSNKVQLAGPTSRVDCTDYRKIYEGICWQVIDIDGHDHEQIRRAIAEAQQETGRPTLIIGHTVMAKGSASREGDFGTHGEPLSPEEIAATKKRLGLPEAEAFYCPAEVGGDFRGRQPALSRLAEAWRGNLADKKAHNAEFAAAWEWTTKDRGALTFEWPAFDPAKKYATRQAWGACLNALIEQLPPLVGGSADLDPSNQTAKFRDTVGNFNADTPLGRNLAFGVREFPMGAIANGIALHGGLIPFTATFLTFSDYMRNAVRMSALQKLPVLHVYTHDSFHLGEDGPTHQSIEHVASLRLIPNLLVLRPADAIETAACLEIALRQEETPSCLCLTRQGLPTLDPAVFPQVAAGVARGGYVLADCEGTPDVVLLATGSEVSLALDTVKLLKDLKIRVVSMPCVELFEMQDEAYKTSVIPEGARLYAAAEAGRPEGWHRYVGRKGLILGIDHFGHSAPANVLAEEYGFTPENLARLIRERLV
ncbi:transketolase [Alkalidesulfovibrio alkalitolerans DSM 16529]|jgi:transketolase|uniref:Transketolase n=1 Tax=Alkalidesulfovibrio alkalitolerans DSM 16529 TaxID=1121439 RepID=S7TEA6_9BACT|nr:transketolase [Alkalidesulfovibrio alkalitolerans]EPR34915.1 transketolase [Alkalidesulfovibrio alkalitolerans DSM 16529]